MKSKISLWSMVALLALVAALAACTPGASAPEQGAAEATQPAEVTQPDADAKAEIRTLFVGSELVECTGVAPQMCMQVRNSPDEAYTFFYQQIEGFTFEPGYEYELLVEVTQVPNPPADGSSLSFSLVEVVSKMPVETTEAIALEGSRWVLVDYLNSAGEIVTAAADVEATAEFKDGTVGGSGSCNRYSGSYTVEGNALTISPLASTMMACSSDEVMQQEANFLANLQAAATYTIEGDRLMIANADGVVTLTMVASAPISLTSVTWEAVNFNNGNEAVVSLLAGTTITAVFAEDGTLSGTAGCNNYTTTYTVEGETMTIGPAASTMMMCAEPEGIMDQEAQYLNALATTAIFQIDGNALTLRTSDGAMVANYTISEAMNSAVPAEVAALLANATYPLDYDPANPGSVTLADGELRIPAAPGSASEIVIALTGISAYGQLADGRNAAAVVVSSNTGGSGTFYDLVVVPVEDGALAGMAYTFLGDRVGVNSVTFEEGLIVVDMVTQGPDDPLCCGSQPVVQTYQLEGDELVLVSSVETATP